MDDLTLEDRMAYYGEQRYGVSSARRALKKLYREEGRSLREIAEKFGVTRPAVSNLAHKLGVPVDPPGRKSSLEVKVRRLGYGSLEEYFQKNAHRPFSQMAEDLKVSTTTIQRYWDEYIESVEAV